MSIDLRNDPNVEVLVEKLIEKTREGKLGWEQTAADDVFIAAVKGVQSFQIRREAVEPFSGPFRFTLVVKDRDGNAAIEHSEAPIKTAYGAGPLEQLFLIAKRVACRVDEKIEESLQLLDRL